MKKFLLIVICVISIYILLIFLSPETSSKIESLLWFSWTTDKIHSFKKTFDWAITDVPSAQEFKSWAIDIWNTLKWSLDTTKSKIDSVRSTLSWAQDSLNSTLDTFDTAVETVKNAKETVDGLNEKTDSLKNLWEAIKWTVNTNDVWAATQNN